MLQRQRRFINHFKTLFRRLNYSVVLSTIQRRFSDVLIITLLYQKYNDIVLTSSLQRRFIDAITTLLGRLLITIVFATFVQRHMMERRCNIKVTAIPRHYNVACLLGITMPKEKNSKSQFKRTLKSLHLRLYTNIGIQNLLVQWSSFW